MRRGFRLLPSILLLITAGAAAAESYRVPANALRMGYVPLPVEWKFSPDDRPENARADRPDDGWSVVRTTLGKGQVPAGWRGIGWFRLHFAVPEDGPYALRVRQLGASEVWLDGQKIAAFGEVAVPPRKPLAYGRVVFSARGGEPHVLAVRYASSALERFHVVGSMGGFRAELAPADQALASEIELARDAAGYLWFFTGIFLAFFALHLLLFAFTPQIRDNLYFSLLCLTVAVLSFFLFYRQYMGDPRVLLLAEPAMNVAGLAMGYCLLRFVYGTFFGRVPRLLHVYALLAIGVALWSGPATARAMIFVFLLMLAAMLEAARVVVLALFRRLPGARLVGAGILAVVIGFGIGLLANLGVLEATRAKSVLIPLGSVVILLAFMSSHISRQFALTNERLREQLDEVRRLSGQQLENERRIQQEQAERRLLEAEYAQKVRELEEARELQLSMLPANLPLLPEMEIGAWMDTATEVGGDYYDFEVGEDGTLSIAVGDATGHGMRAGTMVTAAKTLFGIFGRNPDLPLVLSRSTLALRRMNLRRLAMALTLARYHDRALHISAAGMPPVYVWRAASDEIEQIQLPGTPLGAMGRFPYTGATVHLLPGDAVLFMTDGFAERLGADDELLGYDRAMAAFRTAAPAGAAEIITSLRATAETWAAGRPADDDVTFVVLKMR